MPLRVPRRQFWILTVATRAIHARIEPHLHPEWILGRRLGI